MEENIILKIKEYIIAVLLTVEAPISEVHKLKEIDKLMLECLEKEIDPILNKNGKSSKKRVK